MDRGRPGSEGLTGSGLDPGLMVVDELYGTGEEEFTSTIRCSIGSQA